MIKYPAIWMTDVVVDSSCLLEEFENSLVDKLGIVYSENSEWTGVTVFSKNKSNQLDFLPKLSNFIQQFGSNNVLGVTYFNLAPNSSLHRHRDMNGNLLFGVLRLHIPLKTNPRAIMEVQKKSYHMPVDTMWILDTSGLHALFNDGKTNRIHLVVDIKYGSATAKYFPRITLWVVLHLIQFIFIMSWKILRDLLSKPRSLLLRSRVIFSRIFNK